MPENEIPWSEVEVAAKDLLAEVTDRLADPELSATQRSNLMQTRDLLIRRIRENEQGDRDDRAPSADPNRDDDDDDGGGDLDRPSRA